MESNRLIEVQYLIAIFQYIFVIIGGLHMTSSNMIMQIIIDLSQILISPIRPLNVSLSQICSQLDQRNRVTAKGVGGLSIMLYGKMGWGRFLAHQHGCSNIYLRRFSKH